MNDDVVYHDPNRIAIATIVEGPHDTDRVWAVSDVDADDHYTTIVDYFSKRAEAIRFGKARAKQQGLKFEDRSRSYNTGVN